MNEMTQETSTETTDLIATETADGELADAGLPPDEENAPAEDPLTPETTWADVAAASAEAQASEPEYETVTDILQVKVTDVALAKIARDNAADDLEKKELEDELESLKEEVKEKKAAIDAIEKRMSERHEAVRTGVQSLKGEWRVVEVFETNTIRYIDPETGLVVHERPMTSGERQQELFATDAKPSVAEAIETIRNPGEGTKVSHGFGDDIRPVEGTDSSSPSDDALLADEEESRDLEDQLDAALAETDDDTAIDATEILEAATGSAEPQMSEPPSKPTRRARRTKAATS